MLFAPLYNTISKSVFVPPYTPYEPSHLKCRLIVSPPESRKELHLSLTLVLSKSTTVPIVVYELEYQVVSAWLPAEFTQTMPLPVMCSPDFIALAASSATVLTELARVGAIPSPLVVHSQLIECEITDTPSLAIHFAATSSSYRFLGLDM